MTTIELQYQGYPIKPYKTLAGAMSGLRAELKKSEHLKGSTLDILYQRSWKIIKTVTTVEDVTPTNR